MKTLGTIIAVACVAGAAFPAAASEWGERIDICTAAIENQGLADVDSHRVKFVAGGGGSTKRVVLELRPIDGGDKKVATCKIRRSGEISVELD
ncbi:MAG: hypothetical protein AAGB02_07160 [Pseudomonadota bacterium]